MRARLALFLALAAGLAACTEKEYHPPSEEQRVAQADSMYEAAAFDTVTWTADSLRIQRGNLVYASECRRCHGPLGRGNTPYTRERQLPVPSLVEPDWAYAGDLDSVRYRIFVGHASGMPQWGVGRLTPREIDAAAAYILRQLRPEVLADTTAMPGPIEGPDDQG